MNFKELGAKEIEPANDASPAVHVANNSLEKQTTKLRSRYRPKHVEHQVTLRDQNQCAYVNQTGKRCEAKRWLDKHHVHEFSEGGTHDPENLETLCFGHHKIRHARLNPIILSDSLIEDQRLLVL